MGEHPRVVMRFLAPAGVVSLGPPRRRLQFNGVVLEGRRPRPTASRPTRRFPAGARASRRFSPLRDANHAWMSDFAPAPRAEPSLGAGKRAPCHPSVERGASDPHHSTVPSVRSGAALPCWVTDAATAAAQFPPPCWVVIPIRRHNAAVGEAHLPSMISPAGSAPAGQEVEKRGARNLGAAPRRRPAPDWDKGRSSH